MARSINRISALRVKKEAKRGLHADGGGLYLQVSKFDTKSWLFRFTLEKKERLMGLGALHTVSLAEAREASEKCRKLLRQGIDPIEQRKSERSQRHLESAKAITFQEATQTYIRSHSGGWKNANHASQWTNTLKTYAYPVIGEIAVCDVDTGLVLKALEPIWGPKTETATRVRGRIESILDWATAREYRQGENPARWRGHLDQILPKPAKLQKVKHHPALPYDEIGNFISVLREQGGVAARGLEFLILTTVHTSEVLKAKWDEIDLDKATWTVPEERMKMGKEHRVPLSAAALEVLNQMREVSQHGFIFPGQRQGSPLSNMALLQLLRRMERGDITVHGFRSTFRDWAAEQTSYPHEMAEMALSHAIGNKVEAAYRRGDMLKKRLRMMDDWAAFCSTPSTANTGNVVAIRNSD